MSTVPTSLSSVTPSGICTKGAVMTFLGTCPPLALIFSFNPACSHQAAMYTQLYTTKAHRVFSSTMDHAQAGTQQSTAGVEACNLLDARVPCVLVA